MASSLGTLVCRRALFGLPMMVFADGACRAQGLDDVRAEWEPQAAEKREPHSGGGLLLCLEEVGGPTFVKKRVPLMFTEMARVARWDVLRISKRVGIEEEQALRFVADQVSRARAAGYSPIVAAGVRQGGWLALLAAGLRDVDATIALAPDIPTGLDRATGKSRRNLLADRLIDAKAKHIAAFFFDEDEQEPVRERRAIAVRRHLEATGATFMVADHRSGLQGLSADGGRFVRRYRDCLLQFIRDADLVAGEVRCSTSTGYAIGADIDFPAYDTFPREMPAGADPALAAFWGRWGGDDEIGTYLILQATQVRPKAVYFQIGFSDSPEIRPGATAMSRSVPFQLDGSGRRLYYKLGARHDLLVMTLKSATELEYEVRRSSSGPASIQRTSIRLGKRIH
jgi:hypothetical protein